LAFSGFGLSAFGPGFGLLESGFRNSVELLNLVFRILATRPRFRGPDLRSENLGAGLESANFHFASVPPMLGTWEARMMLGLFQ
jgi:hypothetical protein